MLKSLLSACSVVLVTGLACAAQVDYAKLLDAPLLQKTEGTLGYEAILKEVDAADKAADAKWCALKSRAEYEAYRKDLHAKYVAAVGGLTFARTPLNAKVVATIPRDGYKIEKVMFESRPGVYVTGLLYLPDNAKFKAPYKAIILTCGHSADGKGSIDYQRGCVQGVQQGFAVLIYDPISQGERVQVPGGICCGPHNQYGALAALLGQSTAQMRLWDGMRVIDYLYTRDDIRKDGVGCMGNSGGGTMTSLLESMDPRITTACPSCYITTLRDVCRRIGPQDAEQNIFGQLKFGLNHTGYVLLPDTKVCVTGRFSDMFPWGGAAQLSRTVGDVAAMLGESGNYGLNFSPGPHGWTESTMAASADWMAAWLKGEKGLLPLDMPKYRAMDIGYSIKKVDSGIPFGESRVTPEYCTTKVEGCRDIHAILRDRLAAVRAKRVRRTADETAALVRRLAVIRGPSEAKVTIKTVESSVTNGVSVTRLAFMYPDGLALPAVLLEGGKADAAKAPVLMVGAKDRGEFADDASACLARGERVLVADVSGTGEIGGALHTFYGAKDTPEEGISVMLYLLGESMVGRRASDILMLADWLKGRCKVAPRLVAKGSAAIAAAHAFAADRAVFANVEVSDAPPSWSELVEAQGVPPVNRYTWCVHGALLEYDWTDLLVTSIR